MWNVYVAHNGITVWIAAHTLQVVAKDHAKRLASKHVERTQSTTLSQTETVMGTYIEVVHDREHDTSMCFMVSETEDI